MEENKEINKSENETQTLDKKGIFNTDIVKDPKKNYLIVTFLLSFLAAFIMWIIAVDYEVEDYEKTFNNVSVQLTGQSELLENTGMQVSLDGDVKLSLTVSGKRSFLSSLEASSFVARVDVSDLKKEGKSEPLKIEIEPINGISITSQSMTYLTVTVEKRVTDTFEIVPLLGTAQLENGVEYSLLCETETVSVTGSESIIKNIKRAVVYVNPNPKNITHSFKSHCQVVLESTVDLDLSSLIISPQYCGVDVVLTKEKSVPSKIKLEGIPDVEYEASFQMSVSGFLISGEPDIINRIEWINVTVPYEKIKNQLGSGKTSFTVKGKAEFEDGITNVNGIDEVVVTVTVSDTAKTVLGNDVHIINCPLGYTAKVGDVEIKLTGLYEELEKISPESIMVTIDLGGISPSASVQKVKGTVSIENAYSAVYQTQCLVEVSFLKG